PALFRQDEDLVARKAADDHEEDLGTADVPTATVPRRQMVGTGNATQTHDSILKEGAMTSERMRHYRDVLSAMARRVRATAETLEEATRTPTSGEASGNLSNTPMHLGDMGTEVFTQELNATLLENEEFIRTEVAHALDRIERGTFGACENCRRQIPQERLDVLPYARYCAACAAELHAGRPVNLNEGRPAGWGSTLEHPAALAARKRDGEQSPFTTPRPG